MNNASNANLIKGIGIGMVAGTVIGMVAAPKHKSRTCTVGKALKTAGGIVDNIAGAIGI